MKTNGPEIMPDQSKWDARHFLKYEIRLLVTLALLFVIYFIFAKTPLHDTIARPFMEIVIHHKIEKFVATNNAPWPKDAEWKIINLHPYKTVWEGEISVDSPGGLSMLYFFYYEEGNLYIQNPDQLEM